MTFLELEAGGMATVNPTGTLVLDATADTFAGNTEEIGGSAVIAKGQVINDGHIQTQVEDSNYAAELESSLTDEAAGSVQLSSGTLKQDLQFGTRTTNHGLVTVDPGAQWYLVEGSSFVNEGDGTLAPQIASASSFGSFQIGGPCCDGPGVFTAGGTLAPVLVGGFVPAANQEFETFPLTGGTFSGTFGAVGNGFSPDYSHESSTPASVGVIYHETPAGVAPGGSGSPGGGAPTANAAAPLAHIGALSGGRGAITVTISCPAGGAACSALTVTLAVTEHLKRGKIVAITAASGKASTRTKRVVIGTASASLAAGASKKLTIKLNGTGRALLAKYGKLATIVTITSSGKTLEAATVHVRPAAKPKSKHK